MSRTICFSLVATIIAGLTGCGRVAPPAPTSPSQPAAPPVTAAPPPTTPDVAPTPAPPVATPTAVVAAAPGDPNAIVQQIGEFYKSASSLQVDSEQVLSMKGPGMDNRMTSSRTIIAERPNRLAIRSSESMNAFDFVSDGEQLITYVPALQKYTSESAPESFDELLANPLMNAGSMSGQTSLITQLLTSDPATGIMQGVTKSEYVGAEDIDGVRAHHLHFTQDQFDWDLWTAADGDPLVLKVESDMTKMLAQFAAQNAQLKGMRMVTIETFRNWKLNAPVDAVAFTFTAPEGVEKVENLFGSMGGRDEEEISPLLGKPAPPVELTLLDGGSLNLESHAGQSIVMLDFWATWCGPCVQELPVLVKVADEYREKGVVFYALNQGEEQDQIQEFLKEQELSFTVALDSEGQAGNDYGVQGIPMLVLIDKAGTVQSVHVGFSPNLEDQLREELDGLLEGKNLAEEKLAKAAEREEPIQAEGVEEVWSAQGRYDAVTVDHQSGTIYAAGGRGQIFAFDGAGQELSSFIAPTGVSVIRAARLIPGTDAQLLGFGRWGEVVVAVGSDGSQLWNETGGTGIDDVWPADLDGDGQDEIIVGYNGGTGLHVFAADGVRRWQYTNIGNVWHVSAGDVVGDEGVEVVSTSAQGQVHLFDADGKNLQNLAAPVYANMVRVGKLKPDDPKASIIVCGSGDGEQIVAIDGKGATLWTYSLPTDINSCDSLEIATGAPWVAAGLRGGLVVVIDTTSGAALAQVPDMGESPHVAWHSTADGGAPLLLVASGGDLKALRVIPKTE